MIISAFDLSLTATGVATFDSKIKSKHWGIFEPKKLDGFQRRKAIREYVMATSKTSDLILFEDLSLASRDQTAHERAGLAYQIRDMITERDLQRYVLVAPTSLKAFVSGKGNAPKELMIKEVFSRFGADCKNNNEADAVGLLYLGMAMVDEWTCTMEKQRETIDKIMKKPENAWVKHLTADVIW